jgi:PIN domain nuclease of toxin-antitoxin system
MRLLLDTHALLWWWLDDPRLSRRASEAIDAQDADVYVSAATAWEIATKVRLGKLPAARRLADEFEAGLAEQGFRQLPITVAHGRRAGSLPGRHGDPFDRILAAQSFVEELPIVSNDDEIRRLGVDVLW